MGLIGEAPPADEDWLSVKDVAAYFRVDPRTIHRWARAGKFPKVKRSGRGLRIPRSAFEDLASAGRPRKRGRTPRQHTS
jgi:excisionase family DNA binding protein